MRFRHPRFALPAALAFALALRAATADDTARGPAPELPSNVKEEMVPMRDGVKLATNIIFPKEGEGPWPTIVTRTPYGKDNKQFAMITNRYIQKGYVAVCQDVRGKFRSEGKYGRPFEPDMEDGYDTIEWVAAQKWCNGKVGISGASAMGITSNLAAAANPPHLVAAFVVVAPQSLLFESSFIGGVFKQADVGNWMTSNGAGEAAKEIRRRVLLDDEWKKFDLIHHLDKIDIPMYNVGGWYDIFCQGNVSNFQYLQNKGREGARGNQKLLMGPFGHGKLAGDLAYGGDMGLVGAFNEEVRWFDYWLKGIDNGIMKEPPVKYYNMASARKGALSKKNGYKTADNWPLPTKEVRYYVGGPNPGLSTEPHKEKGCTSTYAFDPKNPVKTVGGQNLTLKLGPMDQRDIGERTDYLRFSTAPLEKDVTVCGRVTVELYASTDGPDTDFMAKLVDVYPDGYEALVLDAPIRCRYREGRTPEKVKMMEPGKPEKLTIDLWSTCITFEAGHKISLHITSSNAPRFEVNPNTGNAPGTDEANPRIAKNTIHHDADHPTALVLPILDATVETASSK